MDVPDLSGVRILDISGRTTDPFGHALLRGGASLVRVEPLAAGESAAAGLPAGWPEAGSATAVHLDLTCGPDRDTLLAILRDTTMLIESWRPGFADILGFGYEAMREVNPTLVYLSLRDASAEGGTPDLAALESAPVSAQESGVGSRLVLATSLSDQVNNPR